MKRPSAALVVLWTASSLLIAAGAWSSVFGEVAGVGAAEIVQATPQISVPGGSLGTPLLPRLRSLLGLLVLAGLAWGMSVDRKNVQWRVVVWGVGLQILFALFILKTPMGGQIFDTASSVIVALL